MTAFITIMLLESKVPVELEQFCIQSKSLDTQ